MSGLDYGFGESSVRMLVACLQLESPQEAVGEWAERNVHTQLDALNFAICLTGISASWMAEKVPLPPGASFAVPPGLTCRADADAHRAVVMCANKEFSSVAALLAGVMERGDLTEVTLHLATFAHTAVTGPAEGIPL